jgi:hypothetical protein
MAMESAFADPRPAQERKLLAILRRNEATLFGKSRGFGSIRSGAEFRRRLPISNYDGHADFIDQMVQGQKNILTADDPVFFAVTSGSTGPRKYIPINRDLEKDLAEAQLYWLTRLLRDDGRYANWKYLYLASPPFDGMTEAGIPYGSISGRIFGRQERHISGLFSRYLSWGRAIPESISAIKDSDLKRGLTARLALKRNLGSIDTANPSTIVFFFRFIQDHGEELVRDIRDGGLPEDIKFVLAQEDLLYLKARSKPDASAAGRLEKALKENPLDPKGLWPGLRIINCWLGGTLSFYVSELRRYTRDIPLRDVGFRASEGFFAIPLSNETPAGVLNVFGHFMEFLEDGSASRETILSDELEIGKKYRLIVTQAGGLYRYDMEDIIEVESFYKRTPVVHFLYRSGDALSVTGEKVTETHFLRAMDHLRLVFGLRDIEFALGVREEMPPRYVLFMESTKGPASLRGDHEETARRLDEELQQLNCEYEAKRASGRLGPPLVVRVRPGSFEEFRRKFSIRDEDDSQYKPRYLIGREAERRWFEERALDDSFGA